MWPGAETAHTCSHRELEGFNRWSCHVIPGDQGQRSYVRLDQRIGEVQTEVLAAERTSAA